MDEIEKRPVHRTLHSLKKTTHCASAAIRDTDGFSKHIAASQSSVGRVNGEGGEAEASKAAAALQAPASARASCSVLPVHQTESNLATHDLPTNVPFCATPRDK